MLVRAGEWHISNDVIGLKVNKLTQIAQVKVFLSSPNTRDAPSLWTNGQMTDDCIKRSDGFRRDATPDLDDTR
ncbi:hypothetical protein PABG_12416 [Paracoccidioides brasiliensis Pb03]|nr:hypothetical protein PABG_12416 [Paracoccidioides brasiliensis Pb03]ODH51589.1 hypothetical protein GX48_02258 [Paracoccidioides brasiliensis]